MEEECEVCGREVQAVHRVYRRVKLRGRFKSRVEAVYVCIVCAQEFAGIVD